MLKNITNDPEKNESKKTKTVKKGFLLGRNNAGSKSRNKRTKTQINNNIEIKVNTDKIRVNTAETRVNTDETKVKANETKVNTTIYIDEIEVKKNKEHSTDIKIDDTYTMRMKYPSLDEFIDENFNFEGQSDNSFDIIASCIDMVFSEEEAWEAKDCTKKELIEFVEQLNSSQFKEIEKFFATMPQLSHQIEVQNPKTKVKSTVTLEGLASFFG